jgi:VanZ family protein
MVSNSGQEPEVLQPRPAALRRWRLIAAAAIGAVLALSLLPVPDLPVRPPRNTDKLVHVAMYAGLTWCHVKAYPRCSYFVLGASLVAYGALVEILQGFAARSPDYSDALANGVGVLIIILGLALHRARTHRTRL